MFKRDDLLIVKLQIYVSSIRIMRKNRTSKFLLLMFRLLIHTESRDGFCEEHCAKEVPLISVFTRVIQNST